MYQAAVRAERLERMRRDRLEEHVHLIMEKCLEMEQRMMRLEGSWNDAARRMRVSLETCRTQLPGWKHWIAHRLTECVQAFAAALQQAGETVVEPLDAWKLLQYNVRLRATRDVLQKLSLAELEQAIEKAIAAAAAAAAASAAPEPAPEGLAAEELDEYAVLRNLVRTLQTM